jgi:serine/threonine-protein kinase
MSLLHEGQVLRDTWEVERLLGEGAFAEVYRVRHRFLGRQAMKVFKAVGMSAAAVERLLSEAHLLSRLGHPNIVRVFDANTVQLGCGLCGFFTMEYVPGGSLEQFWRSRGGLLPVPTAVDLVCQVCSGLAAAHGATPPIIHRDIKPANILVEEAATGPRVRLSDFGLARHVNPLTLLASARGTVAYLPPEALRDWQAISRAGDVWAVGCTLYLLLTGHFPYPESLAPTTAGRVERALLVPPGRLNALVDADLEAIVTRTLAVRPEQRHPDAQALLDELTCWKARGGMPSPARAPVPSSPSAPPPAPAEEEARRLVREALALARQAGQLGRAADLLEAACRKHTPLREEYEDQLKLWRRGILM